MSENQPVNFEHIAESFELALQSHDDVPEDAVSEIITTVEEACANNEQMLMWESDYEQFMSTLDGVLDGIYGNGYDEQVKQLDDIREKMEPTDG
jgi:hypothetical protein